MEDRELVLALDRTVARLAGELDDRFVGKDDQDAEINDEYCNECCPECGEELCDCGECHACEEYRDEDVDDEDEFSV